MWLPVGRNVNPPAWLAMMKLVLCGLEVPGVPESSELQMKLTSPLTFQQIILFFLTDPIPPGCSSRNCAVKTTLNPRFVT